MLCLLTSILSMARALHVVSVGCGSLGSNSLQSPRYPNRYPKNMHCVWHVTIPQGMAMRIYFVNFRLEYDCRYL